MQPVFNGWGCIFNPIGKEIIDNQERLLGQKRALLKQPSGRPPWLGSKSCASPYPATEGWHEAVTTLVEQ
jgi:hypothetical protein